MSLCFFFSPLIVALCITVTQAKAWILAVLGTVVAYDLTQTSEDPWSLRVYRGELRVGLANIGESCLGLL